MLECTWAAALLMARLPLLESFTRPAVVQNDGFACYRMRIVEGNGVGRRPKPRGRLNEGVRTQGVLRIERLGHGNEINRRLRPAFGKTAMPERKIAQRLDLPYAILANIVVFVDAAFPPCALLTLRRLVQSRLHHRPAAQAGSVAIRRDVDDHLQLRMFQQPAVARAVMALGEIRLKASDVEAPYAGLALVDAAEEPHVAILREQVDHLVVLRLVDEIPVRILDTADLVDVLLNRELVFELFDSRGQGGDIAHAVPLQVSTRDFLRAVLPSNHNKITIVRVIANSNGMI